jgi:hypothetical protein
MLPAVKFDTTRSVLPSAFKSATAIAPGHIRRGHRDLKHKDSLAATV